MNKRQKKKHIKKISYPIIDEMNLLTLNKEEYVQAMNEFQKYAWKHWRYKHYRDKYKFAGRWTPYHFPVGESVRKYYETALKTVRTYHVNTVEVIQSIDKIKEMYPDKL